METWRQYLLGCKFIIKTDHQSLKSLLEQQILTPLQQKFIFKLLPFDFEVQYKKGRDNVAVDALSRMHDEQATKRSGNKICNYDYRMQQAITLDIPVTWQECLCTLQLRLPLRFGMWEILNVIAIRDKKIKVVT